MREVNTFFDTSSESQTVPTMPIFGEYATRDEFFLLNMRIQQLTDEISRLSDNLERIFSREESSVIKILDAPTVEATVEEAKEKIQKYYLDHAGDYIYPDEVADELGLDLKVAIRAVNELLSEGSLEGLDCD
jgi:hypothetical protein